MWLSAELGVNDHHQNELINYMRFARSNRALRLKTIDSCFQDLKSSRLVEDTFTVDEVSEMLDGLQVVVHGEVESELINTAHTNVLLLRQLFSQAEKFYLKLQSDISELENRELLEQVAEFEKAEFTSSSKKGHHEPNRPKLAPLNEGGVSELLNKEIARLQEENNKLKTRLRTIETQLAFRKQNTKWILQNIAKCNNNRKTEKKGTKTQEKHSSITKTLNCDGEVTGTLDEKCKLEKALKDLQKTQSDQKGNLKSKEIATLENTVEELKCDFQKTLDNTTATQKNLEVNLAATKQDLLKVQEQLTIAEKELEKKFQQTAAYRNMKEMLTKKNEQIKDIRKRLLK
ncbi:LZTL1 protein, partial [Polypterus senegalus]|nr:LZTL1 protein [Polypterus senegalus]